MRTLRYEQYEFHDDAPEVRHGSLAEFVLDVPYLVARGVIPPLHILNEVTQTGGGDAGMGPGTGWEPFQITAQEYEELVLHLGRLDLGPVRSEEQVRFVPGRIIVDETLRECPTHLDWLEQVHKKYP